MCSTVEKVQLGCRELGPHYSFLPPHRYGVVGAHADRDGNVSPLLDGTYQVIITLAERVTEHHERLPIFLERVKRKAKKQSEKVGDGQKEVR